MVENHGLIFTGEFQSFAEESMIIGGGLYLCENNSSNFSQRFASWKPGFHL